MVEIRERERERLGVKNERKQRKTENQIEG